MGDFQNLLRTAPSIATQSSTTRVIARLRALADQTAISRVSTSRLSPRRVERSTTNRNSTTRSPLGRDFSTGSLLTRPSRKTSLRGFRSGSTTSGSTALFIQILPSSDNEESQAMVCATMQCAERSCAQLLFVKTSDCEIFDCANKKRAPPC